MYAKSLVFAALVAAMAGAGNQALAQYGLPNQYGYPTMMPPGPMYGPGPAMAPGMGPEMFAGGVVPAGYAAAAAGPGCTNPTCSKEGCKGDCCCERGCGCYKHCWSVFGEFLYLRPRDAEVAYAVPIDGNITDPSDPVFPIGPIGVANPDFQPGFRFGFSRVCSDCTMVEVTYSQLDATTNDAITVAGGTGPVVRSLVSPLPINAAVDSLDAEAHLFVQFKTLDVDYKSLIAYGDDYRLAFVLGLRLAKLNQEFDALFETNGFDTVNTDVEFEGGGIKIGLEAERCLHNPQWFAYAQGDVAFLGGESRATYIGTNDADASLVDTQWEAGRMVTMTDLELGLGWQNCSGCLRLSGGYTISTWYNIVRTNEWISAVQKNNYSDEADNLFGMMSFDGITARAEFLW